MCKVVPIGFTPHKRFLIGFYPRVVTIDTPISVPYFIDKTTFY